MKFIYNVPGYLLVLFGGFFLSWGGLIVRLFETPDIWQILFLRSFFFILALIIFLFLVYKRNTFQIINNGEVNNVRKN